MPRPPQKTGRFQAAWDDLRFNLPIILGSLVALTVAAGLLIYGTGGVVRVGGGERTDQERVELLSSGDCAVRVTGEPIGRIIGVLTPTQGMPKRRYQVEAIDQRRVLMVYADEVRVFACASLLWPQGLAP
jgi:hypothetical protein